MYIPNPKSEGSKGHKVDYRKLTRPVAVTLLFIFCIFVFLYERHAHDEAQSNIERHASVIADALWNFNPQGASEYLSLACKSNNYNYLVVTDTKGAIFQKIVGEGVNKGESLFISLGLVPEVRLKSNIVHGGQTIGRIEAIWNCDTLYLHVYILLALTMVYAICHLYLNLLQSKQMLKDRVLERTKDLNDLNVSLQREVEEHQRAREELVQSEERFRAVFEQAAVGVTLCNSITGQYIRVNQKYCDIIGYTHQEIDRLSFQEITHPDDLKEDLDNMQRMLDGEIHDFKMDKRYFRKDGSVVWVKITVSPMRKADEKVNSHIAIVEDITERKQIEEAVRDSEKKYRELADALPQIVFETDAIGNLTYVNKNAFKLFRYTQADFDKGVNALQMIIPEDRDRALENMQKVMSGIVLGGVEYTALRKDGTSFPVIIHSNPIIRQNKPVGLRGLIVDMGERIRMETDLKRRGMAMDQSTEAILITNAQGNITYVNPAFEKISGYSRNEVLDKNPSMLQSGQHDEMFYSELWQTLSKGGTWSGRFINKKKDGSSYTEETTISPVFSDRGEIVSYVSVKRDITERLRLEARLQQSKKMEAIGLLAGGVAHDLNNVLSGIVSYPDLLLMEVGEDSPLRKPILTIQKSGQKAADIVQDLLTLARRGVTSKEVLNINDIIRDYIKSPEYEKLITYHSGVSVEILLDNNLMNIEGAPVQLKKIVMNLVSNAAEAQPSGGKIQISTRNQYIDRPVKSFEEIEEGEFAVLEVKDWGFGIAAEDIARIFEPFYTKKAMGRSGTGLGMAVVWGTTHDHSGYIDVETTEGIGTAFSLYFPVTRKTDIRRKGLVLVEEYMGEKETILVVDDIGEQRDIAANILGKLNYIVATVSSGEDAVRYMKNNSADLLILDMIMAPGIDGLETYKRILAHHPNQKAIIASGYSETDRVKEAQMLGAGDYLKKPYTLEKIGLAVKKELRK